MKKIFNGLFLMLLSFIFINSVNAECSYKERKQLLNEAKSVDIAYEPVLNSDGTYSFKFNILGLTDSIFLKYFNSNNGEEKFIHFSDSLNGLYSFIDNNSFMIYDYNFVFYSGNLNCVGYELYTKKVKKPMYNIYSENEVCSYDSLKDFEYCKKFHEKDYRLTYKKFTEETVNRLYESNNISTENNVENNFVKEYYIYLIIPIVFILISIIILIIRKKKAKL